MNELEHAQEWYIKQLRQTFRGDGNALRDLEQSIRRGDIDEEVWRKYQQEATKGGEDGE